MPFAAPLADPSLLAAVADLAALAVRLNRPGFAVFLRYSGHIDLLDVEAYPRGWNRCEPARRQVYLAGMGRPATPADVRGIATWLRSLSDEAGLAQCPRCGGSPHPPTAAPPVARPAPAAARPARLCRYGEGRDRIRGALSGSYSTTAELARRAGVSQQHAYALLLDLHRRGEAERAGRGQWRAPQAGGEPPEDLPAASAEPEP